MIHLHLYSTQTKVFFDEKTQTCFKPRLAIPEEMAVSISLMNSVLWINFNNLTVYLNAFVVLQVTATHVHYYFNLFCLQ